MHSTENGQWELTHGLFRSTNARSPVTEFPSPSRPHLALTCLVAAPYDPHVQASAAGAQDLTLSVVIAPNSALAPSHAPLRRVIPWRAHLVGIAGAGMQSLARLLHQRGCRVTGSDAAVRGHDWLARAGVRVERGHAAGHLPRHVDTVIYSSAVDCDGPELFEARRRGIPQHCYAAMLGRLMQQAHGVAIAGTHGKSTTAAMTARVLEVAGLDPSAVVGACSLDGVPVARAGDGRHLVVEACEYRANFLHLTPQIAAILNIDDDHFDCFRSADELDAAFAQFARRMPAEGLLVTSGDCTRALRAAAKARCTVETFGTGIDNRWRAVNLRTLGGRAAFEVLCDGKPWGEVQLRVLGRHQALNALAAIALATAAGARREAIIAGLETFAGLRRRLELLGTHAGVTVVDDYAHHPTEITAALAAVREAFPQRPLCCIFQPHQFSRTAKLFHAFADSLTAVDRLAVADIYRAREPEPRPGDVSARELAVCIARRGTDVLQVHAPNDILEQVYAAAVPGDVIVTLGAGDLGKVAHGLVDRLRTHRSPG